MKLKELRETICKRRGAPGLAPGILYWYDKVRDLPFDDWCGDDIVLAFMTGAVHSKVVGVWIPSVHSRE